MTDSSTDSDGHSAIASSAKGLLRQSSSYTAVLRRFAVVIVALTVLGTIAASLFALRRPTTYTATAAILVTSLGVDAAAGRSASPEEDNRSVANAIALAETRSVATEALVEVTGSAPVEAIDALQSKLAISQRPDTSVLEIKVTDEDPERAAALANAIGEAYQSARAEIPSMGAAYVIDDAEVPTSANGLPKPLLIVGGAFLGLLLGVTAAFILEQFRVEDSPGPRTDDTLSSQPEPVGLDVFERAGEDPGNDDGRASGAHGAEPEEETASARPRPRSRARRSPRPS